MNFMYDYQNERLSIQDISWAEIEHLLKQIDPISKTYFILEADSGSYIQCAGGPAELVIEYRDVMEKGFKHYVLGKGEVKSALKTVWRSIVCSIGNLSVHDDEVLTCEDALITFKYFFENISIPYTYKKRNITREFKG